MMLTNKEVEVLLQLMEDFDSISGLKPEEVELREKLQKYNDFNVKTWDLEREGR